MTTAVPDKASPSMPRHAAVIGAAGALGQGILQVCRAEGIAFTAIVRSRPERIVDVPAGSRVAVVTSLADRPTMINAFSGADVVISAIGTTSTSADNTALLSQNMGTVESSMLAAGVDRLIMINTMVAAPPGQPATRIMRFFSWLPGKVGKGAAEQQAVVDALGNGALASIRWTLVRAGVNARGRDEPPVASLDREGAKNSWFPVSYEAMGRWMLEEAAAERFVGLAPLVSRRRGR